LQAQVQAQVRVQVLVLVEGNALLQMSLLAQCASAWRAATRRDADHPPQEAQPEGEEEEAALGHHRLPLH